MMELAVLGKVGIPQAARTTTVEALKAYPVIQSSSHPEFQTLAGQS